MKENKTKKEEAGKSTRRKSGIVVSDKMDKSIVVEVTTLKTHKKYRKKYRDSKRYKVHDEKNEHQTGEKVFFEQCRPMSGSKKWVVVEK